MTPIGPKLQIMDDFKNKVAILGTHNRSESEVVKLAYQWAKDTSGKQYYAAVDYTAQLQYGGQTYDKSKTWRAVIGDVEDYKNYSEFRSSLQNTYKKVRFGNPEPI